MPARSSRANYPRVARHQPIVWQCRMSDDETPIESAETYGNRMLGRWNSFVRRARIGRQLKQAALTVSSYANNDGTSVKCGVARFAADCEIGYSTARRYLAWLRDAGLLELVKAGSRASGRADEYRLVITPAARAELDVSEDEYRKIVEDLNVSNQSSQKARRVRNQRSPIESAEATDHAESSALTQASANDPNQRSFSAQSALTQDEPLPLSYTSQDQAPPTGGAPPPDPRRPQAPPSSGLGTYAQNSPSEPVTQHQALQRNSRPHASAEGLPPGHVAPVHDFFTREVS